MSEVKLKTENKVYLFHGVSKMKKKLKGLRGMGCISNSILIALLKKKHLDGRGLTRIAKGLQI